MKKGIISAICIFAILTQNVFASVLGESVTNWSHEIATGTTISKNVFMSDQKGVGLQTEYVATYAPNSSVVPTVINGSSIWGLRNIEKAEEYMKEQGMVPLIGINASFFSFQTGVPMGHVISDGKILSKDGQVYNAIGFKEDGSAFIASLDIKTTLSFDGGQADIEHINKYSQSLVDIVTLYTTDFDTENHNDCNSLYLILGDVDGELSLGQTVNAVVEEKFEYQGSIKIPEGKMVLNINLDGKPELFEKLNSLNIGDSVEIFSESTQDARWESAKSAMGSVGDVLVSGGNVQSGFAKGANPRTAVGVTENGNVIFYVIDGRQPSYSYGVQLKTLATRMKELGCVDAINLDGGGSTAISGIYPGTDNSAILNSPSEGKLRSCSNYLFLKNNLSPTGDIAHLYLYPFEQHYLSGYSETVYTAAADSAYYKTDVPGELEFSASGESTISSEGVLTAKGDGKFTVSVTGGGITGSADYTVYRTPTEINVYNAENGDEIQGLHLSKGDSIRLEMIAKYNDIDLKSNSDCFKVEIDDSLGYIENGEIFITSYGGEGEIRVRAGDFVKKIPVTVFKTGSNEPFYDINGHWAKDMINSVFEKNIVSGYEDEKGLCFKPENNISREEFAVIVCRAFEIAPNQSGEMKNFADRDKISDWAAPYISAAVKNSLILGKSDGDKIYFSPKDNLTRAEAMTILGRTIDDTGESVAFADSAEIPDWAMEHISVMVKKGCVNGYEDNTIRPNGLVTRAEAVTMISKMLN